MDKKEEVPLDKKNASDDLLDADIMCYNKLHAASPFTTSSLCKMKIQNLLHVCAMIMVFIKI